MTPKLVSLGKICMDKECPYNGYGYTVTCDEKTHSWKRKWTEENNFINIQKEKDDFILNVFELAFGEFSFPPDMEMDEKNPDYRMPFEYDEVLGKIKEFETNSFKVEDLDESDGFSEGDTIKIMGTKYVVRLGNDDGMTLEKENSS